MIGVATKIDKSRIRALERLADKGVFRSLGNAAAAIRSTARFLITRSKKAAGPGEPIHTRKGQAKRSDAILFDVDGAADEAVVGFTASVMDESMKAHEHGTTRDGVRYPARPTMEPAFQANLVRFADEFRGSIGE